MWCLRTSERHQRVSIYVCLFVFLHKAAWQILLCNYCLSYIKNIYHPRCDLNIFSTGCVVFILTLPFSLSLTVFSLELSLSFYFFLVQLLPDSSSCLYILEYMFSWASAAVVAFYTAFSPLLLSCLSNPQNPPACCLLLFKSNPFPPSTTFISDWLSKKCDYGAVQEINLKTKHVCCDQGGRKGLACSFEDWGFYL